MLSLPLKGTIRNKYTTLAAIKKKIIIISCIKDLKDT